MEIKKSMKKGTNKAKKNRSLFMCCREGCVQKLAQTADETCHLACKRHMDWESEMEAAFRVPLCNAMTKLCEEYHRDCRDNGYAAVNKEYYIITRGTIEKEVCLYFAKMKAGKARRLAEETARNLERQQEIEAELRAAETTMT